MHSNQHQRSLRKTAFIAHWSERHIVVAILRTLQIRETQSDLLKNPNTYLLIFNAILHVKTQ